MQSLEQWQAEIERLPDTVSVGMVEPRVLDPCRPPLVRRLYQIGAEQSRERIWVEAGGPGSTRAGGLAQLFMLRALSGSGVSRYRHLALMRARFAFVVAEPERFTSEPQLCVPTVAPAVHESDWVSRLTQLPASASEMVRVGAPWVPASAVQRNDTALQAAKVAFRPTILVRLEDWAGVPGGQAFARAGLRQLESFHLSLDLHQRLAAEQRSLAARPWWMWRPGRWERSRRLLSTHPGAALGAFARRYIAKSGFKPFSAAAHRRVVQSAAGWVSLALDVGRYAAPPEVRSLRAPLPTEEALWRFGADGIAAQTFDDPLDERVGAMMALVEAVTVHRLGLERD